MNIILLGAPGAGKGTIASQMSERYKIPHISTGDIFRSNIDNETELGKMAKSYIDDGKLVPDDITTNMTIDRLANNDCNSGFILDGFPRTISQAESLDKVFNQLNKKIDLILLVDATEKQIVDRLAGRRVCSKCGASYHIINLPPKIEGICDECGGSLIIRKDDKAEIILERLKTYREQTFPLIGYYKSKNILKRIPGFVDSQEERLNLIDSIVKGDWACPNY